MSGHGSGPPLEIERTFLLRAMPEIPSEAVRWRIEQGYMAGDGMEEGRLRRVDAADGSSTFTHTIKRGTGLVREEHERRIDAAEFSRLWPLTEGRRLRKIRHRVERGPVTWEIDEFIGLPPIEGRALVMAEVEIPAGMQPEAVDIPPWIRAVLVREVTEEPRFRNFSLATASATI